MKEGWRELKLEDLIAEMRNGTSAKQNKEGKGFRVTRIETIASGEVNPGRTGWIELDSDLGAKFRLQIGDILFSHINSPAHLGKSAIYNMDDGLIHGMNLMLLRPTKDIDAAFLQLFLVYLKQTGYWLSEGKQSINQASVNQKDIKKVIVPLPPLEEQQAIVDKLDRAFAGLETARANAEANLENAKELFQSASIEHLFSDNQSLTLVALGDVCDFKNGFAFKSNRFGRSGVPVVRIGDIQDGHINLDKAVYANQEDYSEDLSQYCIEDGDLVIAMSGATTGKIGFNRTGLSLYQNQRVGRFLAGEKLSIDYLARVLETKVKDNLAMSAGSAQPNLSTKQINSIEIALPTLEEQNHIVDTLSRLQLETDRLQQEYNRQLSDLDELKQSLLQKAFAGELT